MKRMLAGLSAWAMMFAPTVWAETPADLARTAAYLAGFQNPDGGFGAKAGGASSLGATSSAVRTLKNTGGSIPNVLGAIAYLKTCVHDGTGGFSQTPGGKTDVATTASGLMALADMKIADEAIVKKAIGFLGNNAKTFEEVRIAVAGLEAVKMKVSESESWGAEIFKDQNADGTFGSGEGKARETGGKAVALLRMGKELEKKDAIIGFLRSAQKKDGGWSKDGGESELDTTYRVMRAFWMLKEKPDIEGLKALVGRCRHTEGGYSVQPGGEATLGGTYYATTILRWARVLDNEPALVETAGFQPLFNGKDLAGWDGDGSLWSAKAGAIVGTSGSLKHNDFLATESRFGSFILKLTFKLVGGDDSNSGVQFRSVRVPGHEMSGYQADIGQGYWGCLYDESRRNRVLVKGSEGAVKTVNKNGWNQYVVDARGEEIRLGLNGVTSVEYHEADPAIAKEGRIALQIHAGGPLTATFKDVYLQRLPEPKEGSEAGPGFHLRTLKTGKGDRKYVVYLPSAYDGKAEYPVVLFLHGSGERGEDGVKQTQVGLGPAILGNVERFAAIAVIPQARKTWAADSEDGKAAIEALDEVLREFKADRSRVLLTGLSMGGAGAWSIAAAHPERFSGVAPVCGRGDISRIVMLGKMPVWAFVGDADRDETVLNTRKMVETIQAAGGNARLTEYRGVGHNSWDRAYNDVSFIGWMVSQKGR